MLKTPLRVNYLGSQLPTAEMLEFTQDDTYSAGGMPVTNFDANYSTGGKLKITQGSNYFKGGMPKLNYKANLSTLGRLESTKDFNYSIGVMMESPKMMICHLERPETSY